jgi:hypothetical protein
MWWRISLGKIARLLAHQFGTLLNIICRLFLEFARVMSLDRDAMSYGGEAQ